MEPRHAAPGPPTIKMRRSAPVRHFNRHAGYRGAAPGSATALLEPPDEDSAVMEPVRYVGHHRRHKRP